MNVPHAAEERFDALSFIRHIKNIGRAYQRQAIVLVNICRTFVEASSRDLRHEVVFDEMMLAADEALQSATEAGKKETSKASKAFEEAKNKLLYYWITVHPGSKDMYIMITEGMAQANEKDRRSLRLLNRLRERLGSNIAEDFVRKPTRLLKFVVFKTLPDPEPLIVPQKLSTNPRSSEVIWNFTRYNDKRRVTLQQNPHFYMGLSSSADAYGTGFSENSLKDFPANLETIYVLIDKSGPGRVYLETKTRNRTFDSVWKPKEVMIFRDIRGRLESEELVGKDIHNPLELFLRHETQSPWNRIQSPDIRGWKPLVRETLSSPNISVRIRMDQPVIPEAQHPADVSSEWPSAPIPSSRHVGLEDQRVSPTHHAYTQDSPQARTHRNPPTAAPPNQSTSSFQSIVTTTSSPTSSIMAQSSFRPTHSSGTLPTPQEPRENVSSARNVMLSQAPVPPSPHSPSSLTRSTDPPLELNGVPPITNIGPGDRDIRHPDPQSTAPSNLLPRSEETKSSPPQNQAERLTNVVGTPKSSTRTVEPRVSMLQRPPPLQMPGMFPGVPVDADTSSLTMTQPVEVPKVSWYKRLFTRTRHA